MADWAVTGIGVGVAVLVPELGVRVFQNPTGAGMARPAAATVELAGPTNDLSERP